MNINIRILRTAALAAAALGLGSGLQAGELPAFPGAEGWGAQTAGGRGGKVIIVDNLNDEGPGSFRAALQETGPRIIVFRVSGVIRCKKGDALNRCIDLREDNSKFTVAGQTSPGGITVVSDHKAILGCYRQNLRDFVIRHVRFRSVSTKAHNDCVGFDKATNFVLDHCDFSGGTDGTLDITYGMYYTLQWCTVANANYMGGDHGGSLLSYPPSHHVSLHHNIWAHHQSRCGGWFHWGKDGPAVENGTIDYRNNVCYNAKNYMFAVKGDAPGDPPPVHVNMVGNTFIAGPDTPPEKRGKVWMQVWMPATTVYESDNYAEDDKGGRVEFGKIDGWNGRIKGRVEQPYEMAPVTTASAKQGYEDVLGWCGAWPRDAMNERVVQEIRAHTGKHKDFQSALIEKGPEPPVDADRDGMPDFWEKAMGLNPADPSDNVKDQDGDGYTNIEEYINDLALARAKQPFANPVYPIPEGWPDYDSAAAAKARGKQPQ